MSGWIYFYVDVYVDLNTFYQERDFLSTFLSAMLRGRNHSNFTPLLGRRPGAGDENYQVLNGGQVLTPNATILQSIQRSF